MSLHLSQATEYSARKWLYMPHLKISQFRHLKRIKTRTYNKPLVAVFLRGKETRELSSSDRGYKLTAICLRLDKLLRAPSVLNTRYGVDVYLRSLNSTGNW